MVKLKILWEKAQRKRALYNCYFYSTIYLHHNNIGAEGAKYVAEALKVNTSLTAIGLTADEEESSEEEEESDEEEYDDDEVT